MAVRTKHLFGPVEIAAGATATVYTCPSGETAIIKYITMVTASAVAVSGKMWIGSVANNKLVAWKNFGGTGDIASTFPGFMVLQPGEVLIAGAVTGAITFAGFGSELEGVAD